MFIDQHPVQTSNTGRNGVSRQIVIRVIYVPIVILEQNSSSILKFTKAPNVMTYNNQVIVPGVCFVLLLM